MISSIECCWGSGHSPEDWAIVFNAVIEMVKHEIRQALASGELTREEMLPVQAIMEWLTVFADDLHGQVVSPERCE